MTCFSHALVFNIHNNNYVDTTEKGRIIKYKAQGSTYRIGFPGYTVFMDRFLKLHDELLAVMIQRVELKTQVFARKVKVTVADSSSTFGLALLCHICID